MALRTQEVMTMGGMSSARGAVLLITGEAVTFFVFFDTDVMAK